jgi:hypothetical protein
MNVDNMVRAFAGTFVLISVLLSVYVSQNWLWLTAFVGFNLLQSSFTGICPLATILAKLGVSTACTSGQSR